MSIYPFLMVLVFVLGYVFITLEHVTRINKGAVALLMGIASWVIVFANPAWENQTNMQSLCEHLSDISQVILFLLGALTVVEIISVHRGFRLISDRIQVGSKKKLLWTLSLIAFFLSAILDNLTTTIVLVTIIGKLLDNRTDRLIIGGSIVVAANAGGAWTPIGDVTTTMLWIGGQVTTLQIMKSLFLPSLVCMVVSTFCLSFLLKGRFTEMTLHRSPQHVEPRGKIVFSLGVFLLAFVPFFKILTGLPPFMAMLFALSVLWFLTDLAHSKYNNRSHLLVPQIMTKIDLSGTLFFLGVLLCVDALNTAQLLAKLAEIFNNYLGSPTLIATWIGVSSAIVDNVPLVAAVMRMYDLQIHPPDSQFWELIAFCAGTGGSMLVIGSAAGVVYMGIEKVPFFWYLKKISLPAAFGFIAGIGVYILLSH